MAQPVVDARPISHIRFGWGRTSFSIAFPSTGSGSPRSYSSRNPGRSPKIEADLIISDRRIEGRRRAMILPMTRTAFLLFCLCGTAFADDELTVYQLLAP